MERVNGRLDQTEMLSAGECGGALAAIVTLQELTSQEVLLFPTSECLPQVPSILYCQAEASYRYAFP